ncbi:peptide-methionine (S)-S-oxide reductase MsrA [Candidatus Nanohalococcus occultus]|uniref:peptide-methionine (S)-S-oxide reductase MsrA n=1 Tax=Candidatus Nanohalococcus occultus TaxID=2978047 RepID=UPI0039DF81BE
MKTATFAGGCFWCIEAVLKETEGVLEATSGYAGGEEKNAKYSEVSTGKTDHREAVQLKFNPETVSYSELLDIFWKNIDPTDLDGQFADKGFQYTTAIYFHNEKQRKQAENSKEQLENSGRFEEPIATVIEEFTTFFPAEEKHQDYSEKNPVHYKRYKKASGRESFLKESQS